MDDELIAQLEMHARAWSAERHLARQNNDLLASAPPPEHALTWKAAQRLRECSKVISDYLKWTPVSERKPERWPVLGVVNGRVTVVTEHPDWWGHKASLRENDGPVVTHWMPLPEAPK